MSDATLTLAVVNTALSPAQAVLYVGQTAQLLVTLTNNTGGALGLATGSAASTLDFYLPKSLALQPDVATLCTSINVPGWTAAANPTNAAVLRLTFVGGGGAGTTWAAGQAISFTLANVTSSAAPATAAPAAVPTNVSGDNVPDSVAAAPPLSLQPAPPAGAVSLAGLLEAELANQGILYVSADASTPLVNTLQLNFKNTRVDANGNSLPLYSGTTPWADLHPAPQPQLTAWFVYATDSGGLASDDTDADGSAWDIALAIAQDQTGGWTPSEPVPITGAADPVPAAGTSAAASPPQWLLQPAAANTSLFGSNDAANLTVAFNNIVSLTPVGHTQLYLAVTGFWQDEQTAYEPLFLTLDINKEAAPPPKVLSFDAPQANAQMTLPVNQPSQQLSVQFAWSLTGVAKIELAATEVVAMQPYTKAYDTGAQQGGVVYDTYTASFPPLSNYASGNIIFTLTAYDAAGQIISNDSQLTFYLDNQLFLDASGQPYATVQVGNQLWMAQNLNYNAGAGSVYYNNDSSNATLYGQLYTLAAAQQNIPAGWRLPTAGDFNNLVNTFGGTYGLYAYQPLIAGGSSGFEGQLGGWSCIPDNQTEVQFFEMGSTGNYWSSSSDGNGMGYTYLCFMSGTDHSQVTVMPYGDLGNASGGYSIRYVCDLDLSARSHRNNHLADPKEL